MKSNKNIIFELDGILSDMPTDEEIQQKHDDELRKKLLSELGEMFNSKISVMEIVCSKKSTPLREGILMAYKEIETWGRLQSRGQL
jgi:hypothetical protein